jgi:hypothetical protein
MVRHAHERPTRVTFDPRNKPIAATLGLALHSRTSSRQSCHRRADRTRPGRLSETSGLGGGFDYRNEFLSLVDLLYVAKDYGQIAWTGQFS